MIIPAPQDALHKAWMYRLLSAIYDEPVLATLLYFKGGTCAAMLGWLDRFSIDLDFDFVGSKSELPEARAALERIFSHLGLTVKDYSKRGLQYFLKYPGKLEFRNTLKIDVTFPPPASNQYDTVQCSEIDRVITAQTRETMFANKLVALMDRHTKTGGIAGRDLYDIHQFLVQGFGYNEAVITERTGMEPKQFFEKLVAFIDHTITDTIIPKTLNPLLPPATFQSIRKTLRSETLALLRDLIRSL